MYKYLSLQEFARAWFAWRKETYATTYSHAIFSNESGLSEAALKNLIHRGSAPNEETLDGFQRAMKLDASERRFMGLLAGLMRTRSRVKLRTLLGQIYDFPEFQQRHKLPLQQHSYLSRWEHLVIRELARFDDFRADPVWLAARVRFKRTPAEMGDALSELLRCGILKKGTDGRVVPSQRQVRTDVDAEGEVFFEHYRQMLELTQAALEEVSHTERMFCSVSVPLSAERFSSLKAEIANLIPRIIDLIEPTEEEAPASGEVYHFNLQLFPLTKSPKG